MSPRVTGPVIRRQYQTRDYGFGNCGSKVDLSQRRRIWNMSIADKTYRTAVLRASDEHLARVDVARTERRSHNVNDASTWPLHAAATAAADQTYREAVL